MYTNENFPSKKKVKEAIAAYKAGERGPVRVHQPGPFGTGTETGTKDVFLEGPHYPKPHSWYAQGKLVDGVLTSVK
jgi:hypothetical protein